MSLQSIKRGAAGIWIALRNSAISAGVPFPLLSYSVNIQQIACSSSGELLVPFVAETLPPTTMARTSEIHRELAGSLTYECLRVYMW